MALLLGVDTGGTYTDAVLVRDETEVLASAKSLTTRHDLAIGITAAVQEVLQTAQIPAKQIALASLSTTLATNALVEGHGQRVGLAFIGFSERDLAAQGLQQALAGDPVAIIAGGHTHAGAEVTPLDQDALRRWADSQDVSAFAVAAQFGTRNPAHERLARDILRATGKPVTCAHELTAKLGGPKRALTAVLNARLVGLTHRLIGRAEAGLRDLGITAPLMVVRGDGALMSAEQAKERPIETILSGPAASLVGASWLTGEDLALVSDIGGTTTDIALLRNGRPAIDPNGAQVGGQRTMVEAVAMRTHGLGGDSAVHLNTEGLEGGVTLGPGRVVPVSLLAAEAPQIQAVLERQSQHALPNEQDATFVRRIPGQAPMALPPRDQAVFDRITEDPLPIGQVLTTRMERGAVTRLVGLGLIQISAITPTDAAHVLGQMDQFDTTAARLALGLVAKRRIGTGDRIAPTAEALAQIILDQLTTQTTHALLESAFAEDDWPLPPQDLARHPLLQHGLQKTPGLVQLTAGLTVPVIGLGASAATYYPAVGERLNARMILPEHAEVANAIGAVVGRITVRRSGTVTAPSEGRYRAHLETGPQDFAGQDAALQALETALTQDAIAAATSAGAEAIATRTDRDVKTATAEAREIFLEATLTVEASGRARIAHSTDPL